MATWGFLGAVASVHGASPGRVLLVGFLLGGGGGGVSLVS